MNLAEARLGCVGSVRERGSVGDIELERQSVLRRAEFGLSGLEVIVANIRYDDPHAGTQQRLGYAEADAARAAGDESSLARQILHDVLPLDVSGNNEGLDR